MDALRTITGLTRDLRVETGKLEQGERSLLGTRRNTLLYVQRLRELAGKLPGGDRLSNEIDLIGRRVASAQPHLVAFNRNLDGIATRLGRATGRGSRNDFLHVIGGITEGITRLLLLGPRFVSGFISKIDLAFTTAAKGGGAAFTTVLQSLGGAASTGIVGILGLAAAAGLLLVAMGPVVALMSGLLGIITALASTISFALIGGVAALAGVLFPLAAGIGVAVLGLTNLSDTLKNKLEKQIRPVTEAFKDLGQAAATSLTRDVAQQAALLAPILESLTPVVRGISGAIRDVGTAWLESASGPGFQRFVDAIDRAIPRMIRKLGRIVDNTAGALGGMFVGAIPFLQDFLSWLVRITDQWSDWANSAEGQNDIKDFLDKAADSAKSLGGFLGSVLGLISELFDAGNKTGNSIFDDMANAVDNLTRNLEENPDALADWFQHAKDLATEIGGLVTSIGDLFDELDDENNRQALLDIIDTFEDLVGVLEDLGGAISPILGPLGELIGLINDLSGAIEEFTGADPLGGFLGAFSQLQDMAGKIDWSDFLGLDALSSALSTGLDAIGRFAGSVANFFKDTPGKIAGFFKGLGKRIVGAVGKIPWGNIITGVAALPARVVGFFAGLAGRIIERVGRVDWERLLRGVAAIPGKVLGFFAGLAGRIMDRITPVPWGRLGEGLRDFISSIPGMFRGLAGAIVDAIGTIIIDVIPNIGSAIGGIFGDGIDPSGPGGQSWASGGLANGAQWRIIGEDGPEAVVPLNRPLSQVDPSVRWLSAVAQGLAGTAEGLAAGGRAGKSIDASGWTIVSPQSDPRAVAAEALNYLVATSFTA